MTTTDMTTISPAEAIKNDANKHFAAKEYNKAIDGYTAAIKLDPSVPAYFCNRALAYIRTDLFGSAIEDADSALALDDQFLKAFYRRASANIGLGRFKQALKDLITVAKVVPNDKDARLKLKECEKIVKQEAFEKAIAGDYTVKSIADSINLENIVVETSYDGPRLDDDGTVTLNFILEMIDHFNRQKQIATKVRDMVIKYDSLVDASIPKSSDRFTVCGDIHGQFYDLMHIFELNGFPSPDNPYLFNGDFVDRGSFSMEVILTLFAFKCLYPNSFYLNRGNHESVNMNKMYGFDGEVTSKFNSTMCELFHEIFRMLPLCTLIEKKILCLHGGLFSKDDVTLDDIRAIDRFCEPPEEGIMCEMLWSDPHPLLGRTPSKRGVGIQFGPDVTANFLAKNDLELLVRSHEVQDDGYVVMHNGKCITVFSAPNYCDQMGNKGAFIVFGRDLKPKFTSFKAVSHPAIRPMAYARNTFGLI